MTYLKLLLLLVSTSLFALETVQVEGEVYIKAPIMKVYSFVSNPMNDHLWRNEVNSMTTTANEVEIGSVYREDAWIGIRRHFITTTEVINLDPPYRALFETVAQNPFFLRSDRQFYEQDKGTVFQYHVDFDRRMIRETAGLNANPKLIATLYKILMKRYLRNLKRILEK